MTVRRGEPWHVGCDECGKYAIVRGASSALDVCTTMAPHGWTFGRRDRCPRCARAAEHTGTVKRVSARRRVA